MHSQASSVASNPTVDVGKDLFVLSDEQILDIGPEADAPSDAGQVTDSGSPGRQVSTNTQTDRSLTSASSTSPTSHESPGTAHDAAQPPAWLAAQMQDPWSGEEAREFWDGVQQARSEAAAYRTAIASPEDARALKELYPGGVSEARAAAERGRLLEEIDRAYFGAAGNSPEQLSASRAQLAQRMLQEDPAAFREMVVAGLQALQESEQGSAGAPNAASLPRLAQIFAASSRASSQSSGVGAQLYTDRSPVNAAPQPGNPSANEGRVASYAAFERAANEDLERSVGSAIERTLSQALPAGERNYAPGPGGQQHAPPLQQRLAQAVRQDVEKALQGDRQLGEQVAQILSSRRFDNDTRAQIVRLISDRAQQLVPGAAKRVLSEWTQTTLAAHRGRTQRADATSVRADVALASVPARPIRNEQTQARRQGGSATKSQAINYRKFSDEQILDL